MIHNLRDRAIDEHMSYNLCDHAWRGRVETMMVWKQADGMKRSGGLASKVRVAHES